MRLIWIAPYLLGQAADGACTRQTANHAIEVPARGGASPGAPVHLRARLLDGASGHGANTRGLSHPRFTLKVHLLSEAFRPSEASGRTERNFRSFTVTIELWSR